VFGSIEEALAARALGPFAFRCTVCGQTHRTDFPEGWLRCLVQLSHDWGLTLSFDLAETRSFDALAEWGVPLEIIMVDIAPASALLALAREELCGVVGDARERWWQRVAEALATMAEKLADWRKGELEWQWVLASRDGILPGWEWWTDTQELARRTHSPVVVWWSQEGREGLVMAAGRQDGRLQYVRARVVLGAGRWVMNMSLRSELNAAAVGERIVRFLVESRGLRPGHQQAENMRGRRAYA